MDKKMRPFKNNSFQYVHSESPIIIFRSLNVHVQFQIYLNERELSECAFKMLLKASSFNFHILKHFH